MAADRPFEEIPSQYDPSAVEPRWAKEWVDRGYFHASARSTRKAYCIVIPPPNVTGRLHVGHALGRTLEDALIRRARMQRKEALWVPGMDHAGIATQVVVEGELVTFRYELTDGDGHVDVATTRVETMLGDTGIAVHPDDDRYRGLVGRRVRHPFDGRELPIVADHAVQRDFGTGAVKVT